MKKSETKGDITLGDLYPLLDQQERSEAEGNLDRYLELALRVYERIRADDLECVQLRALTAPEARSRIQNTGSSPSVASRQSP